MVRVPFSAAVGVIGARADDGVPVRPAERDLVKQANAPISSIPQIALQDAYASDFAGVHGEGNAFVLGVTMPLPAYRLLPLRQLSLLTIPAAITPPRRLDAVRRLALPRHRGSMPATR